MNSNVFFEASAPGRLDVMGGIADYSGSLVLQMPICEETKVRIKLRNDFICTIESKTESGEELYATVDYRNFLSSNQIDYTSAQDKFKSLGDKSWAAYIIGCALVLQKEKQLDFRGADFFIESSVPLGKGVSSSASLEVATMKALQQAFAISFAGTELPTLAQRVENFIVGAPCGLMDQLSCCFAKPKTLLPIICQPDQLQAPISIPSDVHFFGIDSGVKHSVGGASYADVRCAAFMGYSIIAQALGTTADELAYAVEQKGFSKLPYAGYLCNISVREFEANLMPLLPTIISGKDFLSRFRVSIDSVTSIDPTKHYSVATCAAHPVYENERVSQFKGLMISLTEPSFETNLNEMGKLMYQSHEGYSQCGLGSDRTNEIVMLAKQSDPPIYGAKITGGGSGGTVCLLAAGDEGKQAVMKIHQLLSSKYNTRLMLFS